MVDFSIGSWAVARAAIPLQTEIFKIDRVTDRLIYSGRRYTTRDRVMATFEDYREAERLRDTIGGIRGERDRRCRAANEWAEREISKKLEKINA